LTLEQSEATCHFYDSFDSRIAARKPPTSIRHNFHGGGIQVRWKPVMVEVTT